MGVLVIIVGLTGFAGNLGGCFDQIGCIDGLDLVGFDVVIL